MFFILPKVNSDSFDSIPSLIREVEEFIFLDTWIVRNIYNDYHDAVIRKSLYCMHVYVVNNYSVF